MLTDASHPDFISLMRQADEEYFTIYGDIVLNYRQHNKPEGIICVALVYCGGNAVGCGAIRRYNDTAIELKRMFVQKKHRRRGIAKMIVRELEEQACALGFSRVVLETGADMEAAKALYTKLGYNYIGNFGPFAGDALCVCMEKTLAWYC